MSKPNILCIYIDQLREDALGCTGNPLIRTPNIDQLALEETRFSEAYVSTRLCTPFRGSMLTGKYGHVSLSAHTSRSTRPHDAASHYNKTTLSQCRDWIIWRQQSTVISGPYQVSGIL